jgi:hypothetical protein
MKRSAASTDVNSITITKEAFGSLFAETWTGHLQEVGAAEEGGDDLLRFGPEPHQHEGRHGGQPLRNR